MKKSSLWLVVVALFVAAIILIVLKLSWHNNPEKASSDLGSLVKAESFAPSSLPELSAGEKVSGSVKAPVKIIVYEDYSNIFSADNAANLDKLTQDFDKKVVFAFRPFASREKSLSLESAMAVECALEQDKWEEMRAEIFNATKEDSLNSDKITELAQQLGLDVPKFSKCLTDAQKQGIILQVAQDAQKFSVYGAPTIFINDELIVGARPYDDYTDDLGQQVEGLKNLVARKIQ